MQLYKIVTFFICLAAGFAYINHRFIRWPSTIGIMVLSLVASVAIIVGVQLFPGHTSFTVGAMKTIDFHSLLMNGMLSFLLFAGAIQIDAGSLKKERWPIITLATVGILISTLLIGTFLYYLLIAAHIAIEYIYCLLFAALISPTDPIAVLAILKQAGLAKSLELKIAGESLFNDGVAVVVFLTIMEVAQQGTEHISYTNALLLFLRQAGGGLLFGYLIGYLSYLALRSIDKYDVEVLITIATVMGGYLLADLLHVSGPLAMVVAGIVMGNSLKRNSTTQHTEEYIARFWELIDELLNAVLFMLIGFEMLVIKMNTTILVVGLTSIFIVLLARWISVALPMTLLRYRIKFERHAITILTWGGLRGGLSVALALSLSKDMHSDLFVPITYIVVIFSIVVQGLTIGKVYKKLAGK